MDWSVHVGWELWLEEPTIHHGMYFVHIDYCICGMGHGLLRKPLWNGHDNVHTQLRHRIAHVLMIDNKYHT